MTYPGPAGATVDVLIKSDFFIKRGDFVALVGRSGTGKSTVLNLIGGLDRPTSGQVLVNGQHLESLSDQQLSVFRNSTVGFVFQSFFLRPLRTALDNVIVPLLFNSHTLTSARKKGREVLDEVGLGGLINSQVRRLSGGQRQRVAIARAIVSEPKLLLADEPTGNLDTATSLDIFELLKKLNQVHGTTIVVVTHDPLVEKFQLPMMTVDQGKVVEYQGSI